MKMFRSDQRKDHRRELTEEERAEMEALGRVSPGKVSGTMRRVYALQDVARDEQRDDAQARPSVGAADNVARRRWAESDLDDGALFGGTRSDDREGPMLGTGREAMAHLAWPSGMENMRAVSCGGAESAPIQGKGIDELPEPSELRLETTGSGEKLPEEVRAKMEAALGMDFSGVRIHVGEQAPSVGALAFTRGTDIFFAPGQYQPWSKQGQELLGHELTHVKQQNEGRVGKTTDVGGVGMNLDVGLEREADALGGRAAYLKPTKRQPPVLSGILAGGNAHAQSQTRTRSHRVMAGVSVGTPIQAQGDKTLAEKAKQSAKELLAAFHGAGTSEDVVYRVLNQPPEAVRAIQRVYDAEFNQHTGNGLVADLKYEFDEVGGQMDWQFVVGQLARAGISAPDAEAGYQRTEPGAAGRQHVWIEATPNVKVAVPGTKVTYELMRGAELHATGSYYSYKWYALNDPETSKKLGKPARVELSSGYKTTAVGAFPGNHKIICKAIYHPVGQSARPPQFYEYPQTVVPEGTLAADGLQQASATQDPQKQLEVLELFLQVLLDAEKQEGSAALDAKVKEAYEKQIAALKTRLASTEGKTRTPIKAVHVDREQARVSPLKVFVSQTSSAEGQVTWVLVDVTNPSSRRLNGEYEGSGKTAKDAVQRAIAAWDSGNRYPPGRIKLEVGDDAFGESISEEFQTDGASFWDSISEFFSEVGFWAGVGAISVGVVTAVLPVPGSRVVSALVWTSIIAGTASAGINIAQRRAEDVPWGTDDAMDVLSIAGNILAGTWMKGAKVIINSKGGTKIATGLLIGQFATDGAQGIILASEFIEQYDQAMAIEDPKKRTDALMELFRSALLAGGMLFLSVKNTKADLDKLGLSKAKFDTAKLRNQSEVIDLDNPGNHTSSAKEQGVGKTDAQTTKTTATENSTDTSIDIMSTGNNLIGRYSNGSHLEIISKKTKLHGGNTIKLDPNKTTTLTGGLNDVNAVATRGQQAPGLTMMGENVGGINILRSPKWAEIQQKHMALKATDELLYWKTVTDEFWEVANKPWLDEAIARGDNLRFVSNPADPKAIYVTNKKGRFILDAAGNKIQSIFGREVEYLRSKGYTFLPDGTAVKPE